MLRALGLLPLTASFSSRRQFPLSLKPSPASLFFPSAPKPYSKKPPPTHFPPESTALRSSINGEKPGDSSAFDVDGTIDDMDDGYLNRLSPEFDSVWDTKPSWCQPWTIVLTGVVIIASSWIWLHSAIISAVVSCLVSAWWYIFLYSYPKVDVYDGPQPVKRSETMKMGKDKA